MARRPKKTIDKAGLLRAFMIFLSCAFASFLFFGLITKSAFANLYLVDDWRSLGVLLVATLFSGYFLRNLISRINFDGAQSFTHVFNLARSGFFAAVVLSLLLELDPQSFTFDTALIHLAGVFLIGAVLFIDLYVPSPVREGGVLRFAYGAVGKKGDRLGYISVAEAEAERLLQDVAGEKSEYTDIDSVVVKVLSGGQGWGKSSFQRMIIESLPESKILYSYISLTEVNNEQDFGRLFTERWTETLSQRYPIMTDHSISPALKDIVRSQSNFFSAALEFIPSVVDSAVSSYKKLALRVFPKSSIKQDFATPEIARAFFHLSQIKEKAWVVVIDEIERSPLPEVYRVIEIIERFKALGRNGLPVQIIFLCVVDEKVLQGRISPNNPHNAESVYWKLIGDFYFSSGIKTINGKIFLPPISPSLKYKMVRDLLDRLLEKYDFGNWNDEQSALIKNLTGITPYISPDGAFLRNNKDALEFAVNSIAGKSPRFIEKVFGSVDSVLASLSSAGHPYNAPFFKLSDVLLMEYGKLESQQFPAYIWEVTSRITEPQWAWKLNDWVPYSDRKEGLSIKEGISRVTGVSQEMITDDLWQIVDVLSPSHRKFWRRDNSLEWETEHADSLSWPRNMLKYLRLAWKDDPDAYTKSVRYLQKQQEGSINIQKISATEFQEFVSFVSFVREDITLEIYEEVFNEAVARLNKGQFKTELVDYDGSYREEVIVSMLRILTKITERAVHGREEHKIQARQIAAELFEKLLLKTELAVGEIYRCINWTIRTDRNDSSGYFIQLIPVWPKGGEAGFKKLMQSVMNDCLKRYKKADSDIYDHEPLHLVQFALYQSWSKNNDEVEINNLRNLASKTLHLHSAALDHFWQPLVSEYKPSWRTFKDLSSDLLERYYAKIVYMPLDLLVQITRKSKKVSKQIKQQLDFWEYVSQSDEYKVFSEEQLEKLSNSNEPTILSYLVAHGYVESPGGPTKSS